MNKTLRFLSLLTGFLLSCGFVSATSLSADDDEGMIDIIFNGDLEGSDVSCFFSKEAFGENADEFVSSVIVEGAGTDGSRGIMIQSTDNPEEVWSTQFFIRLPQVLPSGTKYHISFDYKASHEAESSSEVHAEPGDYIYWESLGDMTFTTEWQHIEKEGTINDEQSPAGHPMRTIAIDLAKTPTATTYYFDNIVVKIEEDMKLNNLVQNSDLEGSDVSCFYQHENLEEVYHPSDIVEGAGTDGSRGIVVQSSDNPEEVWETQFFIRLPRTLPAGTLYHISFDYKASHEAESSSEVQAEPGDYIYWVGFGDHDEDDDDNLNYTTEWQHFEHIGTLSQSQSPTDNPMRTFALSLSVTPTVTTYYFDNIVVEIDQKHYVLVLDENSTDAIPMTDIAFPVRVERSLKANTWSTLCLPFSMTGEQVMGAFGDDVVMKKFVDFEVDKNEDGDVENILVHFDDLEPADGLDANYPCLIKVSDDIDKFMLVTVLEPDEESAVVEYDNGQSDNLRHVYGALHGVYTSGTLVPENCLFLSGNNFWYSVGLTPMKAFRAYFWFEDMIADYENAGANIQMVFDQTTTIGNSQFTIDNSQLTGSGYYTLDGLKLNKKPTQKGVYIYNGKKQVVK